MLWITDIIYKKLDKSTPVAATSLDLAKAVDTVHHRIVRWVIWGNAHKLISNYLQKIKQQVKVIRILSDFCEVRTGVPQGTILGPLFFIEYIMNKTK